MQENKIKKARSYIFKFFRLFSLAIVLILLSFLFLLPSILSTPWGNVNVMKPLVHHYSGGNVNINSLNISWFGSQTIENLDFKNEKTQFELSFTTLTTETPLWKLIFSLNYLGPTELLDLNASFFTPEGQKIEVNHFNASLAVIPHTKQLGVKATGEVSQNGEKGQVDIETFSKLPQTHQEVLRGDYVFDWKNTKFKVRISDLPTAILERLIGFSETEMQGVLVETLGKTVDLTMQDAIDEQGILIQGESLGLTFELLGKFENGHFELLKVGHIDLTTHPEFVRLFEKMSSLSLTPSTKIHVVVSELTLPLHFKALDQWMKDSSLSLKATMTHLELKDFFHIPETTLQLSSKNTQETFDFEIGSSIFFPTFPNHPIRLLGKGLSSLDLVREGHINIDLQATGISTHLMDKWVDSRGLLYELLGKTFNCTMSLNGKMSLCSAILTVKSDQFTSPQIRLELEGNKVRLASGFSLHFPLAQVLEKTMSDQPLIGDITNLNLWVESFSMPLYEATLKEMKSKGRLTLKSLEILGPQKKFSSSIATLNDLATNWDIDMPKNKLDFDFFAKTEMKAAKQIGTLKAKGHLANLMNNDDTLDLTNSQIYLNIEAEKVPSVVLGTFANIDALDTIVGPLLDIHASIDIQLPAIKDNSVELRIKGDQFIANAELNISDKVQLKKPAKLVWDIHPQGFAFLRSKMKPYLGSQEEKLVLDQLAELRVTVDKLSFPFGLKNQKPIEIDALASVTHLHLRESQKTYALDEIRAHFQTQDLEQKLGLQLDAYEKNSGTQITMKADLDKPLELKSALPPTFKMDITTQSLPVDFICSFFCLSDELFQKATGFIGDTLSSKLSVNFNQMNGPLNMTLRGSNGNADIDGKLVNGVFSLNKPLAANVSVTPSFVNNILHPLLPLFGSVVGSDEPISIQIPKEGFFLPLYNWNLAYVNINRLELKLGQMYFNNDSSLADLLSVINYRPGEEYLAIWFTPLYLSLNNGTLNLERMDMLVAGHYPFALWGTIGMIDDRVRLVLGFTGTTLANAFGVKNIPTNYILQIPIRGTTKDASVDKRRAMTKIGALVMQSKGPQGAIVGTVLDILGSGREDERTPAPTTYPFPWEGQEISEETQGTRTPSSPIKALQKSAGKMLKSILK